MIRHVMQLVSAITLFSVTTLSFAVNLASPQCTPITVKADGKNIILTTDLPKGSAQIYFLRNNAAKSVWLDHPMKKTGLNAGWSSYLRKDNWSALVVNRKEFSLSCSVIQPGNVDTLNCSNVITICKPAQVVNSKRGTFWLIEDKSWNDVLSAANKFSSQAPRDP